MPPVIPAKLNGPPILLHVISCFFCEFSWKCSWRWCNLVRIWVYSSYHIGEFFFYIFIPFPFPLLRETATAGDGMAQSGLSHTDRRWRRFLGSNSKVKSLFGRSSNSARLKPIHEWYWYQQRGDEPGCRSQKRQVQILYSGPTWTQTQGLQKEQEILYR